ncbi:pyridoxal-dependent decarboxylase domain protein [Aspergillus japonicus CBS 114.51]|uniref:Pyridoxal-dependent decarboxylase domain protein n=1 Tax=Aspergillus japonicus CBS 114.51 TaxID=1448312 RepID=A0A8T8WS41_ASPJA|nr:pyridoxal-dependent decarboxylase domain protein [Aspergillus japonicus CBS 114.51]RAH78646.1 pyridoxal-dependent decarboxylase domain protein [Aspergillus japonicus CBS 114.51]
MAAVPPAPAHAERGEDQITNQNVINNYFIGPRAANMPDFRANINAILDELLETRLDYYPEDNNQKFITKDVRRSAEFRKVRDNFGDVVRKVAQLLGEHSVPFWSPRYEAHMCTDLTMPSLLGYFMTMLYNPNNVALEASPMTTVAELLVGQQLGELFGYRTPLSVDRNEDRQNEPMSWGHITCDGTVANLESIWVARNLKFYPLALHQAITKGKLKFISNKFMVETCKDGYKKFVNLQTWDLLNLKPKTVLDLPDQLYEQFGISSDFLKDALDPYNIQSAGLMHEEADEIHQFYRSLKAMKFIVSKTNHYSWPKGLAIAGLGSSNLLEIEVDDDAHIDLAQLRATLNECLENKIPVYAVVAVIGSTEEGAVDRLSEIVKIREMQKKGLSFLVHADAAWGGYFATMLHRGLRGPERGGADRGAVPALTLRKETETDLLALRHADSITVDPHKAGYIPYPAGSLVYRDGRMRYLVTWSSPYLSQGSSENIGVYGVEGSKPGAAAMSTWLSNQTIGLDPDGYGKLLGQASFTSSRLSVRYAVHSDFREGNRKDFICVPFNKLPKEKEGYAFNSQKVEDCRDIIRTRILGQQNEALLQDPVAMNLLRQLGSDTNINAFALNFYVDEERTTLNTDIEEANYLMKRVVDRLSITGVDTDPTKIPVYLTSTKFEPKHYGACAKIFMSRLGLNAVDADLFVLRNVVMSPFPTKHYFIGKLWDEFEKVVNEEVKGVRTRNDPTAHKAQFLLQGMEETGKTFLVLQTSFHTATLRQQLIVRAALSPDLEETYRAYKSQNPEASLLLVTQDKINLQQGIQDLPNAALTFTAAIYNKAEYLRTHENPEITVDSLAQGEVTIAENDIIKSRPLNVVNRDPKYPDTNTPFYLYGTPEHMHISHVLVRAPNIALSAADVSLSADNGVEDSISADDLANGLILALADHPEVAMQPVSGKVSATAASPDDFFFRRGRQFKVHVWRDPKASDAQGPGLLNDLGEPFWTGTLTLGEDLDYDSDWPNKDPAAIARVNSAHWREELLKIGNVLNAKYRDPAE